MEEAHRLVLQQVERRPLGVSTGVGSKYVEAVMDKALSLHGALDRTTNEASFSRCVRAAQCLYWVPLFYHTANMRRFHYLVRAVCAHPMWCPEQNCLDARSLTRRTGSCAALLRVRRHGRVPQGRRPGPSPAPPRRHLRPRRGGRPRRPSPPASVCPARGSGAGT